MKVKDLIATVKPISDRLLYYHISPSSYIADVIFTEDTIHHIQEEFPHIFEKEVKEWHFEEQCDPFTLIVDADTLYISTEQ